MTKVKQEESFTVFADYRESFPDESSVEQWLSFALSIQKNATLHLNEN